MQNSLLPLATPLRHFAKLIPVASAACLCSATWAQEATADEALPTISVKASRKTEPDVYEALGRSKPVSASTGLALTPRETPQSVSTVERELIEQRSLTSVDAVLRGTTGVHVSFYDTQRPLYYSRGFLITDFQVDGLPTFSNSTNQEFDTAIYERVEIVRGANGILTGVGTPSATINLIRKRPTRTFSGTASVSVGSWDYYRGEVDLNVPLNQDGSVRSRWVVAPQKRHSFRDRYQENKYALLGVIEADIGRSTVASVGYQRQKNDPKAGIWGAIPRFASDGSLADLPRSTSFSPDWTRWSRESGTLFATLEHQFNATWSLKATLNHTEGDTYSLRTYGYGSTTSNAPFPDRATGTGVRLYGAIGSGSEAMDTLDARLSGQLSFWGRKHDVFVGFSSLRTDTLTDRYTGSYSYTIPNLNTWDGSAPEPTGYTRTGAYTNQQTSQDAVYASARWRLAEPLSLLTGVRYTNWRRHTDNYGTTGAYVNTTAKQSVGREPSPFLGVVYDLTQNLSAYASHTGIFNPQNYRDRNNNPLDPVKGTSNEIGIKGDWPTQGISGSFAVFEVKQDNYGVVDIPNYLDGGTVSAYAAVNGTKTKGWEADMAARLTSNWQATAGVTRVLTTRNAADLTYANLPEWLVKLGTQYRMSGVLQPVELGAQLLWQGQMDAVNVPSPSGPTKVKQSPFGLLNLNASWRFTESTSVNLAVTNALDKTYWATLDYANYGEPRFISLTLRTRF
ncbi:MAG: TonB-dependent siderophore receptor [Aquabacterium sp.]|jgi:outer-membrane receptor for ferric coprogen and ferric-rhodotorulic acid|uniref:TonB-dependent siderophore receptor n=1 Tax=Aquabacterium sp. TaxID=1872578 RepID=UPI003BB17233